jgi:general secretion pathway protein B
MSLLLDALDRADKERGQHLLVPSPPVAPTIATANKDGIKRWRREMIMGLLLLGFVLYILFFRSPLEADDPVATTSVIETPPNSESSFMPEVAPIQATPQATVRQPVIVQIERSTQSLARTEPAVASKPDSVVSKLYQQENNREAVVKNETIKSTPPATTIPTNTSAVIETEKTTTDPTEAFFQRVPLLSDMPTEFKRRIPSLKYSTHVYSQDIKGGFVNINGPFREVGSQLAPGLVLIAILPEGVVLEFDGVLFQLRALNDWVGY